MKRHLIPVLLLALLILSLSGCGKNHDGPPDPGTPEPAPLNGLFSCGSGSFLFNGDGESVTVEAEGDLGEIIPSGEMKYYFKWYNRGLCRYDVATVLQLSTDKSNYEFDIISASAAKIQLSYGSGADKISFTLEKEG